MRLYHSTTRVAALAIIAGGFRDTTGPYLTQHEYSGVWVSDKPLDENEGAKGSPPDGDLIEIDLDLPAREIEGFEWVEDGKGYREFLVPAERINTCGRFRIVPHAEFWDRFDRDDW